MKRSEINRILIEAQALFARHGVRLPPFCDWTPQDWERRTALDAREVAERGLGWDVTDLGSGFYSKTGLCLVTLRNGLPGDAPDSKNYAEKAMISLPGQVTPAHFHHYKMEDIIVRGGGRLVVRVWNATAEDGLADTPVKVVTDGVERTLPAGGEVVLGPGESISLPPRMYHSFWGHPSDGTCIIGEVSKANDDRSDNRFLEPLPRYPGVQEDEPPYRLLVSDYATRASGRL
jgi:D-lyxose ketol-isomerase